MVKGRPDRYSIILLPSVNHLHLCFKDNFILAWYASINHKKLPACLLLIIYISVSRYLYH
jgi:hypothetical protein